MANSGKRRISGRAWTTLAIDAPSMPTSVRPMPAAIWPAVGGMLAELVDEQQHDAGDRDQRAPGEAPARPLAEQRPAEQARRDQQQREHGRDDARGDVPLGEIDRVEVDAELGEAEERRGEQAACGRAAGSRPSIARPPPSRARR